MASPGPTSLDWSAQFTVNAASSRSSLVGDKIILPPSALEGLLAAAATTTTTTTTTAESLDADADDDDDDDDAGVGPSTSTFDPFNPYSFAAERAARAQLRATRQYYRQGGGGGGRRQQQQQQQLPHPLTFRLVNPINGMVVYAGIREFSANEGEVVMSAFLRQALGLGQGVARISKDGSIGGVDDVPAITGAARVTVHARQLPKGTLVRLRPLEAGYDVDDWKSLLEQYLRMNFTTLTKGKF